MKFLISIGFLFTLYLTVSCSVPPLEDAIFFDDFRNDLDGWVESQNENVNGKWEVIETPEGYGLEDDKGLFATEEMRQYAISKLLDEPYDNKDKDFVIQYEVKSMEGISCGGFYLKLIADIDTFDQKQFSSRDIYSIMFGGDVCGETDKVHFIFNHVNPLNHVVEEKHLDPAPLTKKDELSHIYTLRVTPENWYEIYVDFELVKNGSLLEDFNPSVNPPKEIDDPTDVKPSGWVDEEMIPDADDVKPDDWVDVKMIVDEEDTMPNDWLEEEDYYIEDPEAEPPAEWDEDFDGEWEPPKIFNPHCEVVSGCGPWKKRTIPNPLYIGEWEQNMIPNPAFIGQWEPRQIPNPDFYEDLEPYNFLKIAAVGIEIWTTKKGTYFDHIILCNDLDSAFDWAKLTFPQRHEAEIEYIKKMKKDARPSQLAVYAREVFSMFQDLFEGYNQIPIAVVVTAVIFPISLFISLGFVFRKRILAVFLGGGSSDENDGGSTEMREVERESNDKKPEKGKEKVKKGKGRSEERRKLRE